MLQEEVRSKYWSEITLNSQEMLSYRNSLLPTRKGFPLYLYEPHDANQSQKLFPSGSILSSTHPERCKAETVSWLFAEWNCQSVTSSRQSALSNHFLRLGLDCWCMMLDPVPAFSNEGLLGTGISDYRDKAGNDHFDWTRRGISLSECSLIGRGLARMRFF